MSMVTGPVNEGVSLGAFESMYEYTVSNFPSRLSSLRLISGTTIGYWNVLIFVNVLEFANLAPVVEVTTLFNEEEISVISNCIVPTVLCSVEILDALVLMSLTLLSIRPFTELIPEIKLEDTSFMLDCNKVILYVLVLMSLTLLSMRPFT